MALALIGEAAIGPVTSELQKKFLELKCRVTYFEDVLQCFRNTLQDISSSNKEIKDQSYALQRPPGVIEKLAEIIKLLEEK